MATAYFRTVDGDKPRTANTTTRSSVMGESPHTSRSSTTPANPKTPEIPHGNPLTPGGQRPKIVP